jgi:hypothetical protein
MAISPELEAQILRYYHAEHWRIGTIATQLGVHHGTVSRVLAQAGLPPAGAVRRAGVIAPYLPFILETLEQFPKLTASRLYAMAKDRGYPGRPDHFRHLIAQHRPRPKCEAYLRLRTLPGEQAQVDWGHFGHFAIGRARRPLMAAVCAVLVAADLPALLSERPHGELPARPCRGLRGLGWRAADTALRQPQERGAGTARPGHPLQSLTTRLRRALS